MRRTRLAVALTVATAAVVGIPAAADAAPKPKPDVPVQLIAMNDFHGRISKTTSTDSELATAGPDGKYGTPDDSKQIVGGSANIADAVERLQNQFAATSGTQKSGSYFVGAGDLISASPFESSVFKDEPTIEVLDAMGLDASSVGNHEFDRGTDYLRRVSAATDGTYTDNVTACEGIVPGETGCFGDGEHAFDGADFPYLAANVVSKETGGPMLPPYQVFDIPGGKKFALIGVVTETTPGIVSPDGVADVTFIDEADAVNKYVPELTRRGVEAIGVLIHEGGEQTGPTKANPDGCDTLTGPIVDINNRIVDEVDLIVSAHTHQAYNCRLAVPGGQPRLVTSAGFYGRLVSDIRLTLNATTGEVDRTKTYQATNVPVTRQPGDVHGPLGTKVQEIVDYWVAKSAGPGARVVGEATADIVRPKLPSGSDDRTKESSLGNLVADAQLYTMRQKALYGSPVIAFMNPGGLRDDLAAGELTYSEIFAVQPFSNSVNAVTLKGSDIDQVLEQQFIPRGSRSRLALGTNQGFTYDYDLSKPLLDRVTNIRLNTDPIDPAASYRVVANAFLTAGGDDFTAFRNGTDLVTGPMDVDALELYITDHTPVSPPAANHGTQIG